MKTKSKTIFRTIFWGVIILFLMFLSFVVCQADAISLQDFYFNKIKNLNYDERASWYQGYLDDKKHFDEIKFEYEKENWIK